MISHAEVQAALSARIDGEDTGLDNTVIDAHLDHCPECSSFWERSLALSRSLSFVEADGSMAPPEDLSDVIYAGVETEFHKLASRRLLGLSIGRVILAILAVLYIVWAGQLVVGSGAAEIDPDVASLLIGAAAVRIGIAAALLLVAWKPNQIPGVLLIVGAMFGFTVGFAVLDAVSGAAPAQWLHLGMLLFTCAALVFMWVADRGPSNPLRTLSAQPQ
ncbi:zf-HC2 domain-containing protein [Corynebacterium sp. MSK044]|uniref:zf-HC2 domain-containing protein n=1 Tax=unclassified Corynebacterium TaxID=2624378 RepID=UPI00254CBE22|nr:MULTISPECIES: zf-HC2 domain-containing protein [unclassified Corynebacterium]MDK8795096.1 zf-HC2 domain-containing protein [Corynebacterium sp. MSK041]MDK8797171.1 zf-HC2 domain-containing protein [Corynebacterium sp. MSK044]